MPIVWQEEGFTGPFLILSSYDGTQMDSHFTGVYRVIGVHTPGSGGGNVPSTIEQGAIVGTDRLARNNSFSRSCVPGTH
jgi:hypothetical protein